MSMSIRQCRLLLGTPILGGMWKMEMTCLLDKFLLAATTTDCIFGVLTLGILCVLRGIVSRS